MSRPRIGAHVSTAGGLASAFGRGAEIGCEALQIFVKSPSQWRARPLAAADAETFHAARAERGAPPVVAHGAYLINLAASDPQILERSRAALADELERCARLGVEGLVVHPGAHLGAGEETGIERVAASLDAVLGAVPEAGPLVLLELTAGQGTVLGSTLEQLRAIRERAASRARLAFCLDTCHAFAAGYELGTAAAVEEFLGRSEEVLSLALVACVHLNDSVGERGSRRDRHANLGEGRIGLAGFARWLAEPRLAGVPMILETPLGDDERGHARDLERLRELRGG